MLTQKHIQNVCMCYQGAKQCRFMANDAGKIMCLKLTGKAQQINDKCNETIAKLKKSKQDPDLQGIPLGDGGSCPGYPYLRFVKQGYDVKKS